MIFEVVIISTDILTSLFIKNCEDKINIEAKFASVTAIREKKHHNLILT